VERVTSRQNALVKRFRALAQQRAAAEPSVLLDGAHLVEEALASPVTLETAVFSESAANERLAPLLERVARSGARVVVAPDAVFPAVSPVQHPSGVAAIAQVTMRRLEDVLRVGPHLLLMLDGVQDPGNLGAIIRVAEGCGATGVIVGDGSADAFGWKAVRSAMGSSLRLPIAQRVNMADALRLVKATGTRVLAAVPRNGTALPECDFRPSTAVLLGGEGAGISEDLLRGADATLSIPMTPPVESLNVAIASALVLYEASRQRAHVAVR
jgi:TrmH family RNA methyltransferase